MDITDLATRLWQAREQRTDHEMSADDETLTLDAAYWLQHEYVSVSGQRRRGWKVGATARHMQEALGLDEPFAGPLLEGTTLVSPTTCALVTGQPAIVEVEFVLRMGTDYTVDGANPTERLGEAVDAVCAGIEVAGTRFSGDEGKPSTPLIIADAAANIALVHGEPHTSWRDFDLSAHRAVLRINGDEVDGGTGSKVMGHPINSLAWLAGFLARRGQSLKRGDLVTTGTVTDMRPVEPGDEVVADFGALGEAKVKLT